MKRLGLIILVAVQSALMQAAMAQTAPAPKGAAKRADACAPIGRTEDGKLVYSMKCDSIRLKLRTRGSPSTMASILKLNAVCSAVCL